MGAIRARQSELYFIECVLIGYMRETVETKQKEKEKSKRKKAAKTIYTRRKVQSDLDNQYFTLHM